jgi:hypothetical protein
MASFEDTYAELFGERPTYDPIDTSPTRIPKPRVAISAGLSLSGPGGLAEDSPFAAAYQELNASEPVEQPEGEVSAGDYGRAFGAGALNLGGAVAGIPEYLARQGAGQEQTPAQQTIGDVARTLSGPRRALNTMAQNVVEGMSPEASQRMMREWTTLDPGKTIWQGGIPEFLSSLSLQATQAAPSTLATLVPGALMLRAGMRGGALTYLGASEGAISVGQIANNIAEEIEGASEEELMQSQRYQQLRQEMGDAEARQSLIQEAQGAAPAIGGFVVGLISAGAGRYLEPKLMDIGGGITSRFARGAGSEAVQEASQGAAEQLAQNIAAQTFDQSRPLFQNVGESAVQGGALGGLMGGTINAAVGRRQALATPGAETTPEEGLTPPAAEPEVELPASFKEIFGEGGPAPQGTASMDEVFTMPGRQPSTFDQLQARQRYVENPQASLQRRSALGPALTSGIDPDLAAAANARQEGMIQDMFAERPNPMAGPGGEDMSQVWARNEQMDLQGGGMNPPTGTAVVPTGEPQQLPLMQERVRGVGRVPLQPMAAQPLQEDMSAPAGFAGPAPAQGAPGRTRADMLRQRAYLMQQEAPTFRDENQIDAFNSPESPAPPELIERLQQELQEVSMETGDPRIEQLLARVRPGMPVAAVQAIYQEMGAVPGELAPTPAPDDPSPEPLGDLMAQLEELRDPDTSRLGVYLSPANIENLRTNGALEQVRGTGVPLANFDGKGGTLIAKNRQVAEQLIEQLGQGADLQQVLGAATGAGAGKVPGAEIAVQLRDENQNVVRESLVADEEAADTLAQQWEAETGQTAVITSAVQAIRRREQKLRQENRQLEQKGVTKSVERKAERVAEAELGEGTVSDRVKARARGALSENEAARKVALLAKSERAKEIRRRERAGDVDDPRSLDFEDPQQAQQYGELFGQYRDAQIRAELNGPAGEEQELESLRERIGALRSIAKATTKSERIASVGTKLSAEEMIKMRRAAEPTAKQEPDSRDYLTDVGDYTDEQVDAMAESELLQAFGSAAKFIAGRARARSTFDEVVKAHSTPSEQRKLIKRVQNFKRRRKYGGKVKTAALTRTAEQKQGSAQPQRKGKFDTRVLSVEAAPRDMSKADKKALAERAKKAFRQLELAINNAGTLLDKARKGEFEIIGAQREPNGELTESARQMLLARGYLRVLAEYGNALQKANNRSAPAAIAEVEKFNELIDKVRGYSPKEFSQQMSKLFLAEERESVSAAAKVDPKRLGDLVYPNQRAKMTALSVRRNAERLARIERIEQHWKKDAYYRNQVSPVMQKFAASIAGNGIMSYKPTVKELRAVQFAMRLWRAKAETRDTFYKPLKRFFTELGVDFDTLKITDDYEWSVPDIILERRFRRRFGSTSSASDPSLAAGSNELSTKQQVVEKFAAGVATSSEALARDVPLKPSEVEKFGRVQAINNAINELRKTIKSGSTLDVIRAEENFVRQLGELGLWSWTNKKVGLGQVTLPGLLRDRTATVRLVAPRLRRNQMTKQEAVQTMMDLYQPVPLSSEVRADKAVQATGRAEIKQARKRVAVEDEIAELMRVEAMTPEQRRLMQAFESREKGNELQLDFDGLTNEPELVEAGAKAATALLDDQSRYPTAAEVLARSAAALPVGNRFRTVMERLLQLPVMKEVYVGWDRTGKVLGTALGAHKITTDSEGTLNTIIINRQQLDDLRAKGHNPHVLFMHALTHEAVHAATVGKIINDPTTRMATWAIMRQTRKQMEARGVDTSKIYAFKDNDPKEFVAEAFSNGGFQRQLRKTMIEPNVSAWQAIINLVKRVLGLPNTPQYNTALDAVLALTDNLFTGELPTRGKESTQEMRLDGTVRDAVSNTLDKYIQSDRTVRGLWQRAKDNLTNLLPALSMEQLRDTYSRHFQTGDRNPMADYMRAFFKRNADNSANMEVADKLSRKWTELAEKDREAALEMSRIMTEATLHQIHPELPLSDGDNAHLTSPAQKTKHAELAKRWSKLPEPMQDLYEDAAEYYDTTLRREVALMTLNALRGYLTRGSEAPLAEKDFDYTEADVEGMGLNTIEGLREEFGDMIDETGLSTIAKLAAIPSKRVGPYFPLMRFGDFVVYAEREKERKMFGDSRKDALAYRADQLAVDPTLDVSVRQADNGDWMAVVTEKEFRTAETRSEAEAHRHEVAQIYGDSNTSPVQLKADLFSGEAAIKSNAGLKTILSKLDGNPAAQAAIKNFYLQSIADSSFRKHELSRKNRRGVNYETQHRTFANYAKQAAYYTSQLRFGWQMADSLREMQKTAQAHRDESEVSAIRMGEVVREINTRDKLTHDIKEVSKLVRGGVELGHFMLLTSPSYWMINATQPYMVTLPWLAARSSIGDAVTALTNAQKLIISPLVTQAIESWGGAKALKSKAAAEKAFSVLEQVEAQIKQRAGNRAPDYLKMLTALKRESIIDLSFIAELRDIASGKESIAQNVLDASRIMAHLTEVNNRIMTALAAYDIGKSKGMEHDSAVEFAKQATSLTQFNYSAGNKPRLFQAQGPLGSLGPLVFQFMQYPQHMYALMISNMRAAMGDSPEGRKVARKTLAGIFATHLAAGGVIGAMLQPIKWGMGLAAFLFGDDDEPFDFDRSVREASSNLFGTELGEIVAGGLPRTLGVDLSNRMSLGTLYMVDLKTDNSNSFMGSLMQSFGGPLVGMAGNAFNGVNYAQNGEWQKAFETVQPKFMKDISKAIRYTSEGMTDHSGKVILDAKELSPYQLFLQTMGLQPAEISDTYARNQARKDAQQHDKGRKESLLRRFRTATTAEERAQIAIEVAEFNKANPEQVITRSAMLRSLTGKIESEQRIQRLGGDFRGREALYAERGEFFEEDDDE